MTISRQAGCRTVKNLAESDGADFVSHGAGYILGDRTDLRLRLVVVQRHCLAVL